MRTLYEIIECVKDGGKPGYDELRYALVALDALATFDRHDILIYGQAEHAAVAFKLKSTESFRRWKDALNKDPKAWLGPNHDPDTAECQRMRKISFAIATKAGVLPCKDEE